MISQGGPKAPFLSWLFIYFILFIIYIYLENGTRFTLGK